jgi:glycosyltransferase involved in cell wall biosynthesis
MRVCMLAYTFYEADNRVRRYAEALAARGDEVEAVALRREGQLWFEVIRGVRVHRIQNRLIDEKGPFSYLWKLLLFFLRSMWFLTIRVGKLRYDVIHVHSVPDFEVFATLVARLGGARIILDIHDIVPEFYASKFNVDKKSLVFRSLLWIERLSCLYAHHVIVANHLWRTRLIERAAAPGKCTAIINYPDPSLFSARARVRTSNNLVMCYPGTLNSHQGLDVAIGAMALLRERVPNFEFLIIGDGPDREKLKRLIVDYGLADRVCLTGLVPMEQVADIMAAVDLGIVPKRKDSFGNEAFSTKIMEFMAMGVTVIASRTRIDEYYFSGGVVQFFESGNAEDLAAKILELAHDPVKRAALQERAMGFIRENNWDIKKREYLDLVDRLMHPPGTPAPLTSPDAAL